jgi:RNA polymerase sigma-70 factor (ECF subfamily)
VDDGVRLDREDRETVFREAAVACLDGLFGFAMALSRDRATAEDLVQETYLRALAARRKAPPEENLKGWLFTILHNVWRNERRRRRPDALDAAPDLAERIPASGEDPQQALDRKETRDRLRRAIEGLPEPFREVVLLRCVEGFSYQQVAQIVGCPAGTVMSRLARARALLRVSLIGLTGYIGGRAS